MCQTTAYTIQDGKEVVLLKDVVTITPENGKVRIVNLFGEEMLITGRIKHMDLLVHKVIIGD